MGLLKFNGRAWLATAVVAVAGVSPALAQTPPDKTGEKIQVSSPAGATNAVETSPGQSTLKQIHDDLFKPFEENFKNSFRDPATPTYRTPQPSQMTLDQRKKEELEKRKKQTLQEWNYLHPDQAMDDATGRLDDGLDKEDTNAPSLLGRTSRTNGNDGSHPLIPDPMQESIRAMENKYGSVPNTNAFNPVLQAIPESDKFLRRMFSGGTDDAGKTVTTTEDTTPIVSDVIVDKAQQDAFKQLLPGATPAPSGGAFGDLTRPPAPAVATKPAGFDYTQPFASVPAPDAGSYSTGVPDNATMRALGLSNPFSVKPPEPIIPDAATLLNPFGTNLLKRKF